MIYSINSVVYSELLKSFNERKCLELMLVVWSLLIFMLYIIIIPPSSSSFPHHHHSPIMSVRYHLLTLYLCYISTSPIIFIIYIILPIMLMLYTRDGETLLLPGHLWHFKIFHKPFFHDPFMGHPKILADIFFSEKNVAVF